jgi:hypothetical protein
MDKRFARQEAEEVLVSHLTVIALWKHAGTQGGCSEQHTHNPPLGALDEFRGLRPGKLNLKILALWEFPC